MISRYHGHLGRSVLLLLILLVTIDVLDLLACNGTGPIYANALDPDAVNQFLDWANKNNIEYSDYLMWPVSEELGLC